MHQIEWWPQAKLCLVWHYCSSSMYASYGKIASTAWHVRAACCLTFTSRHSCILDRITECPFPKNDNNKITRALNAASQYVGRVASWQSAQHCDDTRLSALSHPHWHIAVKSYHIVKPPRHNTNMRHTCCTMSSSAADETRRYIRQSSMRPSLAKRDIDDPTMCPCAFEPTAVAIFRWWRPYAVPCNAVGRCYYVAGGGGAHRRWAINIYNVGSDERNGRH